MRWVILILVLIGGYSWTQGQRSEQAQLQAQQAALADPAGAVQIFTTAGCGSCQIAKAYFRDNGIAYVEYDVGSNRDHLARFQQLGGNGVPLIIVSGQQMTGFSPTKFEEMRGGAGGGVRFFR